MNSRYRTDRTSARAIRVAASSLLALSALSVGVGSTLAAGASGSIWTTNDPCSDQAAQNTNEYGAGDTVYVRGDNFAAVAGITWAITGAPGGGSGDPNLVVASGSSTTDGIGAFCLEAYVVANDDWGVYSVDVTQGRTRKNDNYHVDAATLPLPTPEPTPEPTVEPTAEPTAEPTVQETLVEPTDPPDDQPADGTLVDPTDPRAEETLVEPTDPPADPPGEETVVDPTDPPAATDDPNQAVLADLSRGGDIELPATDAASDILVGGTSIFIILGLACLGGGAVLLAPSRRRESDATE